MRTVTCLARYTKLGDFSSAEDLAKELLDQMNPEARQNLKPQRSSDITGAVKIIHRTSKAIVGQVTALGPIATYFYFWVEDYLISREIARAAQRLLSTSDQRWRRADLRLMER